jgi:hypothetical protein
MNTIKSLSIYFFIILGLLPSFFVTEALCEDWVLFSKFKNGDILYYDSDNSVHDQANTVQVRTKTEYSRRGLEEQNRLIAEEGISRAELKRRGYDRLCHTVILWKMKCQDNMACMLTFTDYDRREKVLSSRNVPANDSCDPITPEAHEIRSIFEMVCNKKQQ